MMQALFVIARFAAAWRWARRACSRPLYISEVAPANIRGRLTTVQQIMIISGLTAAFLVNYFLAASGRRVRSTYSAGIEAWRWMYLMQAIPAAIFLVALFFIPESPRYLVTKGRDEEATNVLTSLFGADEPTRKLGRDPRDFAEDHRPRLSDIKGAGHAASARSSGPGSCWRRSSSSSASTSSSITARRCGSSPACHEEPVAAEQHRLRRWCPSRPAS